jgi:hypothetical protein
MAILHEHGALNEIPAFTEWVPIPALPLMSDVAVRVANRSIVGLPLCESRYDAFWASTE